MKVFNYKEKYVIEKLKTKCILVYCIMFHRLWFFFNYWLYRIDRMTLLLLLTLKTYLIFIKLIKKLYCQSTKDKLLHEHTDLKQKMDVVFFLTYWLHKRRKYVGIVIKTIKVKMYNSQKHLFLLDRAHSIFLLYTS